MLLQDGDALRDALVTDMCGCARDKASDRIGFAAAERAAQTMRVPAQEAPERCKAFHIPTHAFLVFIAQALDSTESRNRPFPAMLLTHGPVDSQLAGGNSSSSW
jgi:hypothetical protein